MLKNPQIGDVIYLVNLTYQFEHKFFILIGSIIHIEDKGISHRVKAINDDRYVLTIQWNNPKPHYIEKYYYANSHHLFSTMKGATNYLSKKCDSICKQLEKDSKKLNHDYTIASQMIYKCSQRSLECIYSKR